MTSYGPPGQPPGPPPPPGSYGPPASGDAAKFDPKNVNPLDWGILAAGVLSLIFSFFSYYTYDAKGPAKATCSQLSSVQDQLPGGVGSALSDLCSGDSAGAWHGFFGWFGVLLALIGAGLIALALFAPQIKLPVATRLAALGAFALAVISTLLALLVVPDWPAIGDLSGLITSGQYDKGVEEGHGFSYWIVLVLLVVGLVLCFLRFQQTGGELPGRPAAGGGTSGYGGPPPAAQQGYPQPGYQPPAPQQPPPYQPPAPQQPPPGYQPPAPQPGYQPPQPGYQPPPPGYQPPQPPPQQYPPQ